MDVPPISPLIFYRDAKAALDFLQRAFGFETRLVVEDGQGGVIHSECEYRGSVVMVCTAGGGYASPAEFGGRRTGSVHVQVPEGLDALCEQASAAGAKIEREPADQPYGDRVFTCLDPEGHSWSFGQTLAVMSADDMAKVTGRKITTALET
jgi:uncharacterized glyoxalase superfamily protein PhnB